MFFLVFKIFIRLYFVCISKLFPEYHRRWTVYFNTLLLWSNAVEFRFQGPTFFPILLQNLCIKVRYAIRNALQLRTRTATSFGKNLAQISNSLKWFPFIQTRLEEKKSVACENKKLIFPAMIYKDLSSWKIVIYWLIMKVTANASFYRCKTIQFIHSKPLFLRTERKEEGIENDFKVPSIIHCQSH